MAGPSQFPHITIVTGPRKSGRTTYAVLVGSGFFQQGYDFLHNGTALVGWVFPDDYLKDPKGLLRLAKGVPENAPILIEEADIHPATRRSDSPDHDAAVTGALAEFASKSCYLILTTVHGEESQIARALMENAWEHVTPYMNADSVESLALATIHRLGRRLIPVATVLHEPGQICQAMKVADTFRETRKGASEGIAIKPDEDWFIEVPQTTIDQMKYPKYPVHYRRRVTRKLGDERQIVHRLSQESRLNFVWLESVNEHPHETVVLEMLSRTMPQWGFEYQPVQVPQNDRFPDGKALINRKETNLEVVSIQPRYPRGHSLHDLVAMSQKGRAPEPQDGGILHCLECRGKEDISGATLENLPEHDETHRWVIYLPNDKAEKGMPGSLTVAPLLTIDQEGLTEELQKAVRQKSDIIAAQGTEQENWVVVIAQGFPVEPQWYSDLPADWPDNVDGIVIAASDTYLGASHDLLHYYDLTMVLLKCPQGEDVHNCYHPSYLYRMSRSDEDYEPISPETHNPEDLSVAAFRRAWPPMPTRRILVVRDEDGNEIDQFEDIAITGKQASEVLEERNFVWRERGEAFTVLVHETSGGTAKLWAEVEAEPDGITTRWASTVYRKVDHLHQEIGEEFRTREDAIAWCEVQIAAMLLDETH